MAMTRRAGRRELGKIKSQTLEAMQRISPEGIRANFSPESRARMLAKPFPLLPSQAKTVNYGGTEVSRKTWERVRRARGGGKTPRRFGPGGYAPGYEPRPELKARKERLRRINAELVADPKVGRWILEIRKDASRELRKAFETINHFKEAAKASGRDVAKLRRAGDFKSEAAGQDIVNAYRAAKEKVFVWNSENGTMVRKYYPRLRRAMVEKYGEERVKALEKELSNEGRYVPEVALVNAILPFYGRRVNR